MDFEDFTKPRLIEPGVKYFLNETLKQCRIFKNKYHNLIWNISLASFFIILLGAFLISRFKVLLEGRIREYTYKRASQQRAALRFT